MRFKQEKNQPRLSIDILDELCVKIPFLKTIKDVIIYSREVRELCLRKLGRKKLDPPTIHLTRKLANILSGWIINPKYMTLAAPL